MQMYRIIDTAMDERRATFRRTLKDAQLEAKKWPADARDDVRIELVTIATDVKAIESYLNDEQPTDLTVSRRYKLSPRGGLVELDANDKPLADVP